MKGAILQMDTTQTATPTGAFWQGYRLETTDEKARALFEAKFGHPAQEVRRDAIVKAGPLTEADLDGLKAGRRHA